MRLVHVTLRSVRSLAGQTDWPISSLDLMREGRPPDVVWEHSGFLAPLSPKLRKQYNDLIKEWSL